VILTSVPM